MVGYCILYAVVASISLVRWFSIALCFYIVNRNAPMCIFHVALLLRYNKVSFYLNIPK